MKSTDAAWLAGFFDGDGNLGVEQRALPRRDWRIRIRVSNCDLDAIERIRRLIGVGQIVQTTLPSGRLHYSYRVEAQGARTFLKAVAPHVTAKRRRVSLALEADKIIVGSRLRKGGRGSANTRDVATVTRLEQIAAEVGSLNQKGRSRKNAQARPLVGLR